jgi:hypothetical protein
VLVLLHDDRYDSGMHDIGRTSTGTSGTPLPSAES